MANLRKSAGGNLVKIAGGDLALAIAGLECDYCTGAANNMRVVFSGVTVCNNICYPCTVDQDKSWKMNGLVVPIGPYIISQLFAGTLCLWSGNTIGVFGTATKYSGLTCSGAPDAVHTLDRLLIIIVDRPGLQMRFEARWVASATGLEVDFFLDSLAPTGGDCSIMSFVNDYSGCGVRLSCAGLGGGYGGVATATGYC